MDREEENTRSSNSKTVIDYPWTKTIEDVTKQYDVNEEVGLSEERVREDLARYGPNGNLRISCRTIFSLFFCRITSRRGQTTLETYF